MDEASRSEPEARFYRAPYVSKILDIPLPTLYEMSRRSPERLGAIRLGRSLRFRRAVIDAIADGTGSRGAV